MVKEKPAVHAILIRTKIRSDDDHRNVREGFVISLSHAHIRRGRSTDSREEALAQAPP